MADLDITAGQLHLVEYERLKEEQKSRIGVRDNLIYATLASMAAVIAATLGSDRNASFLLLLPPVCVVLGWTYLMNDEKISAIGLYLRDELSPALTALAGGQTRVLGWEDAHRRDAGRRVRKTGQLLVDLCIFCLSGLTAVVVYWVNGPFTAAFLAVSIVEIIVTVALGTQIVRYADRSSAD
jgi:hypothetical protein